MDSYQNFIIKRNTGSPFLLSPVQRRSNAAGNRRLPFLRGDTLYLIQELARPFSHGLLVRHTTKQAVPPTHGPGPLWPHEYYEPAHPLLSQSRTCWAAYRRATEKGHVLQNKWTSVPWQIEALSAFVRCSDSVRFPSHTPLLSDSKEQQSGSATRLFLLLSCLQPFYKLIDRIGVPNRNSRSRPD